MKAINYKLKKLNSFVYFSKGNPRDLQLSRTSLTSTKKNIKYDEKQKIIYFFCAKPVWKPVNS